MECYSAYCLNCKEESFDNSSGVSLAPLDGNKSKKSFTSSSVANIKVLESSECQCVLRVLVGGIGPSMGVKLPIFQLGYDKPR